MPDQAMQINSMLHSLRSFIRPPYRICVLISKSSERAAMRGMVILSQHQWSEGTFSCFAVMEVFFIMSALKR